MSLALTQLAQALDRCAEAGQELATAVGGGSTDLMHEVTDELSLHILEVQRALQAAMLDLARAPAAVRKQWADHLRLVSQPVRIGAELATLHAASTSARLAELARITGADLSYSQTGQLAR